MRALSNPAKRAIVRRMWGLVPAVAAFTFLMSAFPTDAPAQELAWAKRMGGVSTERGQAVTVDGSGNVFTTGFFRGVADFDPGPVTRNLTSAFVDTFVSKLSNTGGYVFARRMGGASGSDIAQGFGIVLDGSGNIYVTGFFQGTVDFDPSAGTLNLTTAPAAQDTFVSKLDPTGALIWARQLAGTSSAGGNAIRVDGSGNVYTTGLFNGTVDFDPGPGIYNLTTPLNTDSFISKLDASGNFVWAKQMGGASQDVPLSIALDGAGDIYTTGWFQGTSDFDPGPGTFELTSTGVYDMFVTKLDVNGDFLWAKRMGDTGDTVGDSIAVDGAGNLYLTGYFEDAVDFDPGPGTHVLTSGGGYDIFVSKLDSDGNFLWANRMGDTFGDIALSIAVDGSGNAYTTGSFKGTVDFDPGPGTYNLASAAGYAIFVSKLDTDGNFLWAKSMSGSGNGEGTAITVGGTGNVYATGYFDGSLDFDPGVGTLSLTSAGDVDIFVFKLAQLPALKFTDRTTLSWNPSFGEASFNTYRSDNALPGSFLCFASHQAGASVTDLGTPASGSLYAYLVTAVNGAGQEGSMGFSAVNGNPTTERPNPNPCP